MEGIVARGKPGHPIQIRNKPVMESGIVSSQILKPRRQFTELPESVQL